MSARARAVLDRFPLHLAATDPEKRFEVVVGGITDAVETLTRQVADVRRSHRLSQGPTPADVDGLAGLHGLRPASWAVLARRLTVLGEAAAADPPDAAEIAPLLALPRELLEELLAAMAETALPATLLERPTRHRPSLELRRQVVRSVVLAHRIGNATPTSLLTAAAAYVGLVVETVEHTEERWWHLATCRDTLRLAPTPGTEVEPLPDVLGLEENPFRRADIEPAPKRHGQGFQIVRGGIDDVTVTVRVLGVGSRTRSPMVVECHAGHGLVFEGTVPDGSELRFEASGRSTLDGQDVTGSTWCFRGAVFGSAPERRNSHDFVFGGNDVVGPVGAADGRDDVTGRRVATFVVTTPMGDALHESAAFPHGSATVDPIVLPRGASRWRVFVRAAHVGGPGGRPPRTKDGRFDTTVLVDAGTDAGVSVGEPSMRLGFAWEEREPFAVRVLLPWRLRAFDDDRGTKVREPLRRLLDRHRAAGVDVRVEYADPRWTLGTGVVRDDADEAIGTVLSGTELWPSGSPQPGGG